MLTPGQFKTFDLKQKKDFNEICAIYGGRENLRNQLPMLYSALETTVSHMPLSNDKTDDFENSIAIEDVFLTEKGVSVLGSTSLSDQTYVLDEQIIIRDADGNQIDKSCRSSAESNYPAMTLETELPSALPPEIQVEYTALWVDASNGLVNAASHNRKLIFSPPGLSPVKQVHVKDPISNRKEADCINICYNRSADCIDYSYSESIEPHSGRQKLFLPLSAWIEFENENDPFETVDLQSFILKVDCQSGVSRYSLDGREKDVLAKFVSHPKQDASHPNGFSFQLDSDWRQVIPAQRLPIKEEVHLFFEFVFYYKSGNRASIRIGSGLHPSANTGTILPLRLLWGCLSEGTRIRMADGTEKLVEQVLQGDHILSRDGSSAVVENVITGQEECFICVNTSCGRTLKCSSGHPILTTNGMIKASDLKGSHRLISEDGETGLTGIWTEPGGNVFNFLLCGVEGQKAVLMLANGLWVGDHLLQNSIAMPKMRNSTFNPHARECAIKRQIWEEQK